MRAGVSLATVALIIAGATLVWKRLQLAIDGILMLLFVPKHRSRPTDHCTGRVGERHPHVPAHCRRSPASTGCCSCTSASRRLGAWAASSGFLATAGAYLAVGSLAFHIGGQTARRRGTLSRYRAGSRKMPSSPLSCAATRR